MKNILIISLIICAFSCNKLADSKYSIKFYNYSSKNVMIVEGLKDGGFQEYPDTVLPDKKPFLTEVPKNDYGFIDNSNKWADVFKTIPSDTLSIYVFDPDTIKFYDWSKIKEGYKILKRYDLSLEDLQKINWTITYP